VRAYRPSALYVHVPFCRSKCGYCDFYSVPAAREECLLAYPGLVLAEIEGLSERYSSGDLGVGDEHAWDGGFDTIFIGGGTPSVLPLTAMEGLLAGLRSRLRGSNGIQGEWTIECNPESLSLDHLDLFKEYGVTRISLGVQSFEEEALRNAGRPCSVAETAAAVELVSRVWRGSWNADLITGLPGQTARGAAEDARRIIDAGASHISLYTLIIEEGTPFHERERAENRGPWGGSPFLPADAEEMWFEAAAVINGAGFERYEVSNFCLLGRECRHNLHYWNVDPYFGVGPGAVSTLLFHDGRSLRRTVRPDLAAYMADQPIEGAHSVSDLVDYEIIGPKDSLKDYLIMSLRTRKGALAGTVRGRFGVELADLAGALPEKTWVREFLECDAAGMRANERGLDRLDGILVELFRAMG
jgi:oxygen-independent coproporphyrinogen III oxidase